MSEEIRLRHQHGDHLRIMLNIDDDDEETTKVAKAIYQFLIDRAHAIRRFANNLGLQRDDIVLNITRIVERTAEAMPSDTEAQATVTYLSASHVIDFNVAHSMVKENDPEHLLKLVTHEMLHLAVGKVSGALRLYAEDERRKVKGGYDLGNVLLDSSHHHEEQLVRHLTPLLWRELQ